MTTDANGTIGEALLAGLRDALEPENGAGRGGVSRATELAAGAALAAAAAPLAKRGATTVRTSNGGRALRTALDRTGLPEKAARRITDANRAVQDWTARQQRKRGVLTNVDAAAPRDVSSDAADERNNAEPASHPERIERFGRQARASRVWATSASSGRPTTNSSLQSPTKSGSSPKPRGSTRHAHSSSPTPGPSRAAASLASGSSRRARAGR